MQAVSPLNQESLVLPSGEEEFFEPESLGQDSEGWTLKKLSPKHKQICSLLAQGLKHREIAALTNIVPQYVTMLLRQPLIQGEIRRLSEIAGTKMEALFTQSVETIADVMQSGKHGDRLKAVRLQLEATKRVGRPDNTPKEGVNVNDRLVHLAERLVELNMNAQRRVERENAIEVPFKQVGMERHMPEGLEGSEAGEGRADAQAYQDSERTEGISEDGD